jgi:osmotically-inducible protein OsmY
VGDLARTVLARRTAREADAVLRRLLGLALLVGIGIVAIAAWKTRNAGAPALGAAKTDVSRDARQLGTDAKALGNEAKEKLAEWGQGLQDAKITASVRTALGLNRRLRPYTIKVDCEQGVVTLQGGVDGAELRARAEAVAAGVPGVTRVVNRLEIAPAAAAAAEPTLAEKIGDKALEMRVKMALSLNRELKGSNIDVSAQRDQVVLSGDVQNESQRAGALLTARETASVATVFDRMQLPGAAATGRPNLSAAERVNAAQRALEANANLAGFRLSVREEGGRLVLRGVVSTAAERDLAGLVAKDGAGTPVENAVEIRSGLL